MWRRQELHRPKQHETRDREQRIASESVLGALKITKSSRTHTAILDPNFATSRTGIIVEAAKIDLLIEKWRETLL